ncbi:unnamed protein product [Clonostachys rosea]|uniref:STAS domain-containing protein n=1 Tax=Bionectria ochroleuca TaxID=29856 RepID=A0ABY6UMI4_BIOOC|nr:unnamed protein product [Clonostachys rosea]
MNTGGSSGFASLGVVWLIAIEIHRKVCNRADGCTRRPKTATGAHRPPSKYESRIDGLGFIIGESSPLLMLNQSGSVSSSSSSLIRHGADVESQQEHQKTSIWRDCIRLLPVVPGSIWLRQHRLSQTKGDIVAALTVASLYIPLSFSFAGLARVPPSSSLYAFITHPVIYALLGSCPLMVVGPEATGSLLIGIHVRRVESMSNLPDDESVPLLIAGASIALAWLMLWVTGLLRLGFVENVLSRPLMQGFISGVGLVLVVEQAVVGFGTTTLEKELGYQNSSAAAKLAFLARHLMDANYLAATVATCSFVFMIACTWVKKHGGDKYIPVKLFPDRPVLLGIASVITRTFNLHQHGLKIIGGVDTVSDRPFLDWPFRFQGPAALQSVVSLSTQIAMLGFLESSVTSRSLETQTVSGEHNSDHLDANSELSAPGVANLTGGFFSTLQGFGGFGRSKFNLQAGGTTPMSSVLLAVISAACLFFATPLLYYILVVSLAAMSAAVGVSMMEECSTDIAFFMRTRSYKELLLLLAVFFSIFTHSMGLGIIVGLTVTFLQLIRLSTESSSEISVQSVETSTTDRPARYPSTKAKCAVISIHEQLTFANSAGLIARIKACLQTGSPVQCILIDLQRVISLDASSVQSLVKLTKRSKAAGIQTIICWPHSVRAFKLVSRSGLLDQCSAISACSLEDAWNTALETLQKAT